MHSNLQMENLEARDHIRDLNVDVLHICILFKLFFYLDKSLVSFSLRLQGTKLWL